MSKNSLKLIGRTSKGKNHIVLHNNVYVCVVIALQVFHAEPIYNVEQFKDIITLERVIVMGRTFGKYTKVKKSNLLFPKVRGRSKVSHSRH